MNTITFSGEEYIILFPSLLRDLLPEEDADLGDAIKREQRIIKPIVLDGQNGIIDGANRLRWATVLALDPEAVPMVHLPGLTDENKRQLALDLNDTGRQDAWSERQRQRQSRVTRVAEHRTEGKSLRAIAEEEKVSLAQVRADLKAATVQGGCTVEPKTGKVKGKDNKVRTAKPKKPAKEKAEADGEAPPKEPAELKPPPATDAWGIQIQPHAEEAFAAVPQFKELISALQHAQKLFNAVANLPGGKFLTLPDVASYRRGKKDESGDHADRFVHEGLETALKQVKNAVPTHTVCPYQYVDVPHPKDCRTCRNLNWTPVLGSSIPKAAIERAKEAHGA